MMRTLTTAVGKTPAVYNKHQIGLVQLLRGHLTLRIKTDRYRWQADRFTAVWGDSLGLATFNITILKYITI